MVKNMILLRIESQDSDFNSLPSKLNTLFFSFGIHILIFKSLFIYSNDRRRFVYGRPGATYKTRNYRIIKRCGIEQKRM